MLLDIGLPGSIDGIELCRRMRAADDWTPVIFVTARDDEVDRIVGLELGADDYVTKPYSPRELAARVRALLRRQQHAGQDSDSKQPVGWSSATSCWRRTRGEGASESVRCRSPRPSSTCSPS